MTFINRAGSTWPFTLLLRSDLVSWRASSLTLCHHCKIVTETMFKRQVVVVEKTPTLLQSCCDFPWRHLLLTALPTLLIDAHELHRLRKYARGHCVSHRRLAHYVKPKTILITSTGLKTHWSRVGSLNERRDCTWDHVSAGNSPQHHNRSLWSNIRVYSPVKRWSVVTAAPWRRCITREIRDVSVPSARECSDSVRAF